MTSRPAFALPHLREHTSNGISFLTDEDLSSSVGVFIAFTGRSGGVSEGKYSSLNLASHVGDDQNLVNQNRILLRDTFHMKDMPLIIPKQVHGTDIVCVKDTSKTHLSEVCAKATAGADAIVVQTSSVGALLCFADCVPVIVVSASGVFAVVHAGWRGALGGIVGKTLNYLLKRDATDSINVYIGPHICASCFETSEDVADQFSTAYSRCCVPDKRHVDLTSAIICDVLRSGVSCERIAVCDVCTRCNPNTYFSYRASGGNCGRQGAFAFRIRRECGNTTAL